VFTKRAALTTATSACLAVIVGLVATYFSGLPVAAQPDDVAFSFTAAGDYGSTPRTQATLRAIAASQPTFHLALGDLNYDPALSEADWCALVHSAIPASVPFEVVTGNREDWNTDQFDGVVDDIDKLAACLPNQMPNMQGTYARDYFFDYPSTNPVARFIFLTPEMAFEGTTYQDYAVGGEGHDWVNAAIDDARSAGIKWTIAAMHVNCISMGTNACGPHTRDLWDLLIAKRVDLILQGHDHDYQRSKQLAAPTDACFRIRLKVAPFNTGCTVNDGQDGTYSAGQGSVLVIVGTGGASLSPVNPEDLDAPYFAAWMGANTGGSFGFLHVDVTSSRLAAAFMRSTPGTFTDQFVIEQP
jgi:hypothetical protein